MTAGAVGVEEIDSATRRLPVTLETDRSDLVLVDGPELSSAACSRAVQPALGLFEQPRVVVRGDLQLQRGRLGSRDAGLGSGKIGVARYGLGAGWIEGQYGQS